MPGFSYTRHGQSGCQLRYSKGFERIGGFKPPSGPAKRSLTGFDDGKTPPQRCWRIVIAACLFSSVHPAPSHALFKGKRNMQKENEVDVDDLVNLGLPVMKNLGISGVLGIIAALALKAVGRTLAVMIGAVFAVIQLGVYLGYVKVDWSRVHRNVFRSVHRKQVRKKGKQSDVDKVIAEGLAIMSQGVPSIGGFSAGFVWGLRL